MWINGALVAPEKATVSVYDHGLLYGDGVFEGIRCYGGRVLKLRTHLDRLDRSARAIRLTMPYDVAELEHAVRETIRANDVSDCYIRLCVTRGVGALGLNPFNCKNSTVFIIVDSLRLYPKELYEKGMSVIIAATLRNHPAALSPRIKSMNYLNNIMAKIEAIDAGVSEAVMLNHQGYVSECTGDNLFIVRRADGRPTLITPPLHAGVLEGVTMNLVIDLAAELGIPFARHDLTAYDLYTADEMFLTGTAAEVIPVTSIDKRTIGDGEIGPITRRLVDAYRSMVAGSVPED
ncbi:MAG: branched-chain-amino-acid transaminase [Phycisphaeraceae bacterium]|nr:branched-chain-amino-acid transaminase [Phycisphaeraceae bacterium]